MLIVTGFRVERVVPKGECELQRALTIGKSRCDTDVDAEGNLERHSCEATRKVFIVARNTIKAVKVQERVMIYN